MKASLALSAAVILVCLSVAADVRAEAIGVIILPVQEKVRPLADNLTEVAMARIAETPGRRLAGTIELRRRLDAETGRNVTACLEQPACLGRVAVSLGVSRLVTGAVRGEEGGFFLSMSLTDVAARRVQSRFFRKVDGEVTNLVRVVQEGVDELLDPRRVPGWLRVSSHPEGAQVTVDDVYLGRTPIVSGALVPGAHRVRVEMERRFAWKTVVEVPPGRALDLQLGERELPPRQVWAPYVAYGSAGGAVLSTVAGALLGKLATVAPSGQTREEVQMDLERRRTYGRLGTTLLVGGAVLGLVSATVFYRYWPDIVKR